LAAFLSNGAFLCASLLSLLAAADSPWSIACHWASVHPNWPPLAHSGRLLVAPSQQHHESSGAPQLQALGCERPLCACAAAAKGAAKIAIVSKIDQLIFCLHKQARMEPSAFTALRLHSP